MINFVRVALIWGLPAIMVNKLVFYTIYKVGGSHECIVDVAYSISHLVAGVVYYVFSTAPVAGKIINIILVALWSLRLGGFLCYTRVLKGFKDERYDKIFSEYSADKFKKDVMVLVQFLFQGLIVFVTSIPLYFLFQNPLSWTIDNFTGLNIMNYIALSIIPFSICLEATADVQLEKFKKLKQQGLIPREELMETGLWRKSRHPNLFFDLVTWTCFAVASICDPISICSLIGPVALFCVMEFLTTPLTEAHMKKKRGDVYTQYVQRTNKYVIVSLLLLLSCQAIDVSQTCECTQLSEYDCYRTTKCLWNKFQLRCEKQGTSDSSTQPQETSTTTYCTKFTSDKCGSIEGCAYIINECVQFTACSSYPFGLNQLCQMVSSKCITDGEICVEFGVCSSYQTNVSCNLDVNGKYCYWDQLQGCLEASDCEKLPTTLKTDAQCREQFSYCTVNPRGGCIASGYNCVDQEYEVQCYFDSQMKQCAWVDGACQEKTCYTAPTTIITEKACSEYFTGCTLNSINGGCRQRSTCNDATIEASCTKDVIGNECFWNSNSCYDKICENAPIGSDCLTFMSTCVASANGGCMSIGDCTKYDLAESCKIDSKNQECYWNGQTCVLHTCVNAPLTFTTYEECAQYKQDCTVNNGSGCIERTCDNAPTTSTAMLMTNYDCDQYKTGCITKLGGGCTVLGECSEINVDIACVVDKQGRNCFFSQGRCKLRTCENAPLDYSTHEQCQAFNNQCTVARSLQGCVQMNCAVLTTQDTCKQDANGNRCYWTGLCYVKTCANAPFDYSTDAQCVAYLNTCTVAHSGRGCITRPNQCTIMTLEDQCYKTLSGAICGWFEGACYDKACFTAPQTSDYSTYEACNAYLHGCTVADEGNGGCVLLDSCTTYSASRSCRYNAAWSICEWTTSGCFDKSCTTAPQDASHDSNDECNTYLSGCIVAPSGQGCVAKPSSCNMMSTSTQCTNTSTNSNGGPCVWIGTCVDRTCTNAPTTTDFDTHEECHTFLPTCTVVATGTGGCMTQYSSCGSYSTFRSCQLASSGQKCAWQYNYCYNRICTYAPDTNSFDSDTECSAFLSTCTVVKRISGLGCTTRYSSCQDLTEQQCIKDSNGNICAWNTTLATPMCQNRSCTLVNGFSGTYTQSVCQVWLSSCVVDNNNPHTSCITTRSSCSSYNNIDNCVQTTTGYCTWTGSACVSRSCTTVQNISVFNHSNCNTWFSTCTVNSPTSCYIKPTNCADYTDYDKCYKNISNFPCTWVNGACIEKTCTNYGYSVTTFNQSNCNAWLSSCSVNPGATACETTRTCANYTGGTFNHSACTTWLSTCTVNGTNDACIAKTCTNHGSNVTNFTNTNCSGWFNQCTNNGSTACKSNRTCTSYGSNITVFNHNNCTDWLSTCTVNGAACEARTCSNYGQNIIVFSHTNCNTWLSSCTVSWDGLSCENIICTNYGTQVTSFMNPNCSAWLSSCQANINATACESNLTCTSGAYTSVTNCTNYMDQCTWVSGPNCTNKICTSTTVAAPFTHRSCTNYYKMCTNNTASNSCQWRTCYNHGGIVVNFTHDACEQWLFQCTVNATNTGCTVKTCTNHGARVTTFDNTNCNAWHPSCNGDSSACVESRVCSSQPSGQYAHTNCEAWSLSCTDNTSSACMTKTCAKASNVLLSFTNSSCTEWLSTCTVDVTTYTSCINRTCTNYGENLTTISHATCSGWSSSCTANISGTACEARTCYNYGTQVTTFDNTNCAAWLTGCVASGSTCAEAHTKCSSYSSTVTHAQCTGYLSICTNSGTSACITRTCALASQGSLTTYNHLNCSTWYKECTQNSDASGCQDRTCTNYGDNLTTFTDATCGAWLYGCIATSTNDSCVSNRTCSNYGSYLIEFTHAICNHWLSTCTVNGTNDGCMDRTCANHGSNVTTFNYNNCNAWLSGCTSNIGNTDCEVHSCVNASTYLSTYTEATCYAWYEYCSVSDTRNSCISNRTCTNHGSNVTTFDHANCNAWLSSCTGNGSACVTKTCTNSNIGSFSNATCQVWLSSCYVNSSADNCESVKTCGNAAANLGLGSAASTYNNSNCSGWLSTCTQNSDGSGCETRTCSNAIYGKPISSSSATDTICQNWLNTCTRTSDSNGCQTKTCSVAVDDLQYGTGGYSHSNCQAWMSTCTVNSGDTDGCQDKPSCSDAATYLALGNYNYYYSDCIGWKSTCTNNNFGCEDKTCSAKTTSFSNANCQSYLNTCYYYGNYDNTGSCTSTVRTCTDTENQNSTYDINTQSECDAWKSGCAYLGSGYGCTTRSCSNYVTANGSSPSAHSDCNTWLSTCTYNSSSNTCVTQTCSNFSQSSPTYANCNAWDSSCTVKSDSSGCEVKSCENFSTSGWIYTNANCVLWASKCSINSTKDACIATCSAASPVDFASCQSWSVSCSVNSGATACEPKSCSNAQLATYNHSNCQNWLSYCTNNGTTACLNKTCYNYATNLLTYTQSTCSTWLSSCTNYKSLGCTYKTCDNYSGTVTNANCQAYLSYCIANVTLTKCITFRTCTNHGSAVTTFTHDNCQNWMSTCTNNSGSTACEDKQCSNAKVTQYNAYTCAAWQPTCTVSGSSCIERTCSNSGLKGTNVTQANCSDWLPQCRANNGVWPQYCDLKTCQNHSISSFTHTNCQAWLPYCTVNQNGNACYTERTCNNYGINIKIFNHLNCETWLSGCTVNSAGNACINKTCFNTNLSTFNDQTCGQWLPTCKVNSSSNGCQIRTCTNYGNALATFTASTCSYWLYYCTSTGSACITSRTCNSYSNKIQKYSLLTCPEFLSTCVPDLTYSSCTARTCSNAIELTSYTDTTCSNWLSTCTASGSACVTRTCANASLTAYNDTSCQNWSSNCTVNNTNDGCIIRTCSNSVVTTYSQTNCTAWLSNCTNGTNSCIEKTCQNYTGTYDNVNCQAWLPYCYVNSTSTACYSLRTCINHNLSTFTSTTCSGWLPACTVNSSNDGCTPKTCYNNDLTAFSHSSCSGWLSTCTVNATNDGCEVRSCTNYRDNLITFDDTTCKNWWKYCKVTALNNACQPKTCWSTNVATFNHTNCYNYLDQCTVNDSTSCGSVRTCTNHGSLVTVFNHANCQWWLTKCTVNSAGTACEEMTCTNHGVQITKFTHYNCQNWMFTCTVNAAATDCELKTCSNYGANVVVYTHTNCLAWLSTCTANAAGSECINKTCLNTTGIGTWTNANCEAWLSTCQLGAASTCASNLGNCASATYNQCVKDTNGDICVWHQGSCKDRACTNFSGTASHTDCEAWLSSCTINTAGTGCTSKPTYCTTGGVVQNQCVARYDGTLCAWVSGACINRQCTHFSGTFNHANCQAWMTSCTVNASQNACQTLSSACSSYTIDGNCKLTSGGTICFWLGSSCVTRTCDHATQNTDYDTDSECTTFLSTCTVARVGGCTDRLSACPSYLQASQCYNNYSGVKCYWNTATSLCSDAICTNAPTSITTHADCQTFLNTCTVNTAGGCIPLAACTSYITLLSCVISSTGDTCEWQSGHCYIKSCATAPLDAAHDTYQECQDYMPNCTVVATGVGGCVALNDCNTYTTERQCVVNAAGLLCGWNGLVCANRSCYTAPSTVVYSNDTACSDYMAGCTVVTVGYGCMPRATNCSDYMTPRQCVKSQSETCYWNSELPIPVCETRTCFNAPSTSTTPALCEQHLKTCYSNMQYCRLQECEDIQLTTDFECKYYNKACTTDGTKCVVRTKCQDVTNPAGCVMDNLNNECEWYNSTCVLKTCFTAPAFTTETECNNYFKGCTTKIFGGCQPKGLCYQASVSAACTTSNVGDICVWDAGSCRNQICEDFLASYDEICNQLKQGCVSDGEKCILPRKCSQITMKQQCTKGTDGPCTWYDLGCTLFLSCSSVIGDKDKICKSANKLCTTNGETCTGLVKCSNYRLKDACQTGIDGDCQWYENGNQSRCFTFNQCTDLPYLTHQECYQQSSNKCTTDYLNGCIKLQKCYSYIVQEQCKVSSEGQLLNTNKQIIRTGYCAWVNERCRDQLCEDLIGESHEYCQTQLKGCTTNGTNCITMKTCAEYGNLMTCNLATGTDGECIFANYECRTLQCIDIENGINHSICQQFSSTCLSDGIQCIPQTNCQYYYNQYSCTFMGTDGQCAWNGQSCSLMKSCSNAKSDMIACQRMGEKCNWISEKGVADCQPHTCSTRISSCNYVTNFNGTIIQTCTMQNEKCVEVDPIKLSNQECFLNSLGTYYWNTTTSSCHQCIVTPTQVNNTDNNSTAVNSFAIIVLSIIELMML